MWALMWPGLRAGNPPQLLRPRQQFRHDVAKGGVGVSDNLHRLAHGGAEVNVDVGNFLAQQFGPVFLVVGRAYYQLERHALHLPADVICRQCSYRRAAGSNAQRGTTQILRSGMIGIVVVPSAWEAQRSMMVKGYDHE